MFLLLKFKNGKVELDLNLSISNPKRMTLQFARMEGDKQVNCEAALIDGQGLMQWKKSTYETTSRAFHCTASLLNTSCISYPAIIQFNMTHSPSLSTSNCLLIGSVTVIKTKYLSYFDDYLGVAGGGVAKNKAYVPLLLLTTTPCIFWVGLNYLMGCQPVKSKK